jgi:hypothetical protein
MYRKKMKLENFDFNNCKFFDYSDGIKVDDGEIRRWIRNGLNHIKEKIKKEPMRSDFFATLSSGNSKVLIEAYRQDSNIRKYLNQDIKYKFSVNIDIITKYKEESMINFEF